MSLWFTGLLLMSIKVPIDWDYESFFFLTVFCTFFRSITSTLLGETPNKMTRYESGVEIGPNRFQNSQDII